MSLEFSARPFMTKEESPNISVSAIDIKGVNRCVKNLETTAVYLCVKGNVFFAIYKSGVLSINLLKKGDRIKILPDTPYFDFSPDGATLIVINKKAWDPKQVEECLIPEEHKKYLTTEYGLDFN